MTRALRIADFYTKPNGQWIQTGSDTELHPESAAEQSQTPRPLPDPMKKQLLDARESKLIKLEFPKTEIQVYGYTAVVYSSYAYELETAGQRSRQSGRVTEVFVMRKGQWVNPGWHMDGGK